MNENAPGRRAFTSDSDSFGEGDRRFPLSISQVAAEAAQTLSPAEKAPAEVTEALPYPMPRTAAELAAGNFPRAKYAWDKFILHRHVNLLYGDGGAGKTLLALHVAAAVAAGAQLFGLHTIQMPVLLVLAEDDEGETKARLEAICGMLSLDLADLAVTTWCLPGCDPRIADIDDHGSWTPGPFMVPLRTQLAVMEPCLLVLDTASDIAALDENKRAPVNTLCKLVLGNLCREFGSTVLVNAHPSKEAMKDGHGYAGSTAWNNAVRNRLTLTLTTGRSSHRRLQVAKTNYGQCAELELFQEGLTFVRPSAPGQSDERERNAVLSVVLDLIEQGVQIVRANGSGQKPKDVAEAVHERFGLVIDARRVTEHLNWLERHFKLSYFPGGHMKRGQRAGYCRPGSRR